MIIDVHTHGSLPVDGRTILITNVRAGIEEIACTNPFSYGIHPYDVMDVDIDSILPRFMTIDPIAIGEIGMDFRLQETAARQSRYFREQVEKASQLGKPVIIHAVRSLPQVLSVMANHPTVKFAIHGFRGTVNQMEKIVQIGGYVSLSPYLPKDTDEIFKLYKKRILLETDETGIDIAEHYIRVAEKVQITALELERTIENNFAEWIGNREHCSF